jgi:hypothetical protein
MSGFEFCEKILELDINVRVCFMSSAEANVEALKEVFQNKKCRMFYQKASFSRIIG